MNNLADLFHGRMIDLEISRTDLIERMGFANQSKGLRRLDDYLASGQCPSNLLKALPNVLGLEKKDRAEVGKFLEQHPNFPMEKQIGSQWRSCKDPSIFHRPIELLRKAGLPE